MPWYTDDILSLKKNVRCTERRWRRTGENKHLDECRNHKNSLTNAIKTAKRAHYRSKISSAGQSQKALFKCINELTRKSRTTTLPFEYPKGKNNRTVLRTSFVKKIEKLQNFFTESATRYQSLSLVSQQLQEFQPATTDEIQKLIKKSASKSCPLDPIPTFLLKECLEELLPAITTIINASLLSASVPISFKKVSSNAPTQETITRA